MTDSTSNTTRNTIASVIGLAIVITCVFWPRPVRELIMEIDTTWTMFGRHKYLLAQVDDIITAFPGIRVVMSTFDLSSKLEVATSVDEPKTLWPLEEKISTRTPINKPGTRPHAGYRDAVERARVSGAKKVLVCVVTDGDTDGPSDEQEVTQCAGDLAANKRVAGVLVLGLKPGDPRTSATEHLLAPLGPLGDRLFFSTGGAGSKATIQQFISKGR